MINLTCKTCGSNNFKKEKNNYKCQYCGTTINLLLRYPKKRLQIIIILLLILLGTVFMGYKLIKNVKGDIAYLTNIQIQQSTKKPGKPDINLSGSKIIYTLSPLHPSSNLLSNTNKILLLKIFLRDKNIIKTVRILNIGTFTSQPTLYNIYYSYKNKPPYGYDKYHLYKNTSYEGLQQTYMYTSFSIKELIEKVRQDTYNNTCKKWPANTHRSNLNRKDNFWTNFCPKSDLTRYLKNKLAI